MMPFASYKLLSTLSRGNIFLQFTALPWFKNPSKANQLRDTAFQNNFVCSKILQFSLSTTRATLIFRRIFSHLANPISIPLPSLAASSHPIHVRLDGPRLSSISFFFVKNESNALVGHPTKELNKHHRPVQSSGQLRTTTSSSKFRTMACTTWRNAVAQLAISRTRCICDCNFACWPWRGPGASR